MAVMSAAHLGAEKQRLLARLVDGLDAHALTWLSGYLAGAAARPLHTEAAPVAQAEEERMTIVYGSQTGNSRALAERLHRDALAAGIAARIFRADAYPLRELAGEKLLTVVISTQGDGDPPDDARAFVEHLLGKRAPRLDRLRFAVMGLGDSSYPRFCEVGRRLDARLEELGATRLVPRADCDVDFEAPAGGFLAQVLMKVRDNLAVAQKIELPRTELRAPSFSRERPFAAEVLANQRITGRGAAKDVRHVELSLAGSGLAYEPGDALGVWPVNPPQLVAQFLEVAKLDGDAAVEREGRALALRTWLASELELTRLSRPLLERLGVKLSEAELREVLGTHQPIDALRAWPTAWTATTLVHALRRLTPRLYSIASSRSRVGDEVHLTVARVDYEAFGTRHVGAASHHLVMSGEEARVRVFVERNERFRLPADASRDVIMIGPGTGVAPFRGFLQERAESGAKGRSWLFFGEQHFRTQFLYQTEWQEALRDGSLSRLSLAFSRDQAEKLYVQHRLLEAGRDVHAWLEGGAHLYVCGDATRMAKDVNEALVEILRVHGGTSREAAEERLDQLRAEGRYLRDVY
jgi:sulfite reductase (NADPH) flavoprotein alpha-component